MKLEDCKSGQKVVVYDQGLRLKGLIVSQPASDGLVQVKYGSESFFAMFHPKQLRKLIKKPPREWQIWERSGIVQILPISAVSLDEDWERIGWRKITVREVRKKK